MSERQFFALSHPFGQRWGQGQTNVDPRPAIVRRVECYTCEFFRQNAFQTDENDNPLPRYFCTRLDVNNARIEQENSRRHPTEQLPYELCVFGSLADIVPRLPKNMSDYISRG